MTREIGANLIIYENLAMPFQFRPSCSCAKLESIQTLGFSSYVIKYHVGEIHMIGFLWVLSLEIVKI